MNELRKRIESEYKVANGTIQDPGKFEGCMLWAPYFYWNVLEGHCDNVVFDENDKEYSVFIINDEDRAIFPELSAEDYAVVLYETDQGFVGCPALSKVRYEQFLNEIEEGGE